jgi:hypothetical protein
LASLPFAASTYAAEPVASGREVASGSGRRGGCDRYCGASSAQSGAATSTTVATHALIKLDSRRLPGENTKGAIAMTFTKEQRETVEQGGSVPMNIEGIDCVVVRADVYEQVQAVLSNGLTHEELRSMLARSAQGSEWLDPAMDIYDDYDRHR